MSTESLQSILHHYLQARDRGEQPDRRAIIDAHPDLAAELNDFFADESNLTRMADVLKTAPFDPNAQPLETIRYFGDYELLRKIAQGGMGVVYQAKQVSLGRIVALKRILKGTLASEADVRRFHQEAKAAANLDHPNIVPIYEVGEHEGQQYFSMKLIAPGRPPGPDRPKDVVAAVATISRAVHHAHQRGILHRDLKPSNILFDEAGVPHVADFGLAKNVADGEASTRSGAIVGTPAYMAPEQARAEKSLTTAVDIWSLGAILYEWLAGRPPFVGSGVVDMLMKVTGEEPPSPRSFVASIDRDLETICLKCLEKEPRNRYRSAEALADDLDRWSRGEPIDARRAGWGERTVKWARRRPAVAALLACLALVSLAGLAGVFWNWRDAVEARKLADKRAIDETEARRVADLRKQEADARKREVEAVSAGLALDRGIALCETGEIAHGLLWMARALRQIPEGNPDLERAIRTSIDAWSRHDHALNYHRGNVSIHGVAFLPDSKSYLAVGVFGGIRQVDTATGAVISGPWPVQQARAGTEIVVDQSGARALVLHDARALSLWDVARKKPLRIFDKLDHHVYSIALSGDGQRLATGGTDNKVRLRDAAGKLLHTFDHPDAACPHPTVTGVGIHALAFSPDGALLASGSQFGLVRLWDVAAGKVREPILHHSMPIRALAFTPDGGALLVACEDQRVYLWDVKTSKQIDVLRHNSRVVSLSLSRDGKRLATASTDYNVRIWDLTTRSIIAQPIHQRGWPDTAVLSPDGEHLLIPFRGELWAWRAPAIRTTTIEHKSACRSLKFSADGKRILVAASDGTARLCDTETGKPLGPPMQHEKKVFHAVFGDGEKTVWTAAGDGVIGEWDPIAGQRVGPVTRLDLEYYSPALFNLIFHPDRKSVLAGGFHHKAVLYDVAAGTEIAAMNFAGANMINAAFAPDGKSVLIGSWSQFSSSHFWLPGHDPHPEKPLVKELPGLVTPPRRHNGAVGAVAFSPDGTRYLLGSYGENIVRLYDAETGQPITPPIEDPGGIYDGAVSPNNTTILVGTLSRMGHARFWDAPTGKSLGPRVPVNWGVNQVAFSPDGRRAAIGRGGYGLEEPGDPATLVVDAPQPIQGTPEHIERWLEHRSRFRLNADGSFQLLEGHEIDALRDNK